MEDNELVEVDFKNAIVEATTERGVKIGDNWFPKTQCKALANYKKGQSVGIVAIPEWLAQAKEILPKKMQEAKKKVEQITQKEQELKIICPNCQKEIVLRFKT